MIAIIPNIITQKAIPAALRVTNDNMNTRLDMGNMKLTFFHLLTSWIETDRRHTDFKAVKYADKFSRRKLPFHAAQGNFGEYRRAVGKMDLDIIVYRFDVQAATGQHVITDTENFVKIFAIGMHLWDGGDWYSDVCQQFIQPYVHPYPLNTETSLHADTHGKGIRLPLII